MTQKDVRQLAVTERKFLRRIYRPEKNTETQIYEIRYMLEVQKLTGKLNIITEIRHKRLSWLGHVIKAKSITNYVLN